MLLVIDDEDYVADMIASVLEIDGYTAHVAYKGRDGLAQAQRLPVDLIIIDIMLPYINGLRLVEQLRAQDGLRAVPIILISAGARPRAAQPMVTFIAKPFDMDDLLGSVERALAAQRTQP